MSLLVEEAHLHCVPANPTDSAYSASRAVHEKDAFASEEREVEEGRGAQDTRIEDRGKSKDRKNKEKGAKHLCEGWTTMANGWRVDNCKELRLLHFLQIHHFESIRYFGCSNFLICSIFLIYLKRL